MGFGFRVVTAHVFRDHHALDLARALVDRGHWASDKRSTAYSSVAVAEDLNGAVGRVGRLVAHTLAIEDSGEGNAGHLRLAARRSEPGCLELYTHVRDLERHRLVLGELLSESLARP
jgi:hypothetical protein